MEVLEYRDSSVVSLEHALRPFSNSIDRLDRRIQWAKKDCFYPRSVNSTKDESAALYMYSKDWGEQSLHYALNAAMRSRSVLQVRPWFEYLKLLRNALDKLPSLREKVWCGMNVELAKTLQENQEIVCWHVTSCSRSLDTISRLLNKGAVLCSIESLRGKNIDLFSPQFEEHEVLFLPGTRLRVRSFDQTMNRHRLVIHLEEIDHAGRMRSMPMVTSFSSPKKTSSMAK